MKKLAALLLLLSLINLRADNNLLQNGDFSDGIAHWDGDCHSPDSNNNDSIDLSSPATTTPSGVVVKLRAGDWTKVTQDFDGKVGHYILTINYSVSPDLKFSQVADDYTNVPGKVGFSRLNPFNSDPGEWAVVINDLGALHYNYWKITPNLTTGVQSVKANVNLDSDDSYKKGFYLLFPPGSGVITLQGITLVPQNGASQ
jgi:hypothetical protein